MNSSEQERLDRMFDMVGDVFNRLGKNEALAAMLRRRKKARGVVIIEGRRYDISIELGKDRPGIIPAVIPEQTMADNEDVQLR